MVKAQIIGRSTNDIELKTSKNGKSFVDFHIAVDTGYGDFKQSNFFRCIAFGKNAENLSKYVKKGNKIYLDCEPHQNRWEKDGQQYSEVQFNVNSFEFLETKGGNENRTNNVTNDFMNIPDVDNSIAELPFV